MQVPSHNFTHILKPSSKELHGWWPGKRECTGERLLINPYNGCSVNCFFCYTRGFPGNFRLWHERGIITVSKNFPENIARQLDSIDVASCGYLSPVCDPFGQVNEIYHYSEKIVEIFVERNIPINVTTKSRIPETVIDLLQRQVHSFAQISILTPHESLRKILSPGGADIPTLLDNFVRLKKRGVFAVARIDPILPYITDDRETLNTLLNQVVEKGASHVISSVLDIPLKIKDYFFQKIRNYFGIETVEKLKSLYKERIGPYLHASTQYREEIFSFLKERCELLGVTFALCMEFRKKGERLEGLNREFMTSINCDGMNVPLYIRKNFRFQPACDCLGNCLNCVDPRCGIPDLAMGREGSKKDWKLRDYRRWSKELKAKKLSFP